MKKMSYVFGVLAVAVLLLTACGAKVTPTATAVATSAPIVINVEECLQPGVTCAALVTDVGRVDDKSFNQQSWEALNQAKDEGLVDVVQYIETADSKDYLKNMQAFGDGGFDIIVTSGFNAGAASMEAAKLYPEVKFICVDQPAYLFTPAGETTPANYVGVAYSEDQSGFLVGYIAAVMSTTHKIGAVAGLSSIPPVWRYGEGYRAGAAYADQLNGTTTEVTVTYHDDVTIATAFTDPEWGKTTADSMLSKGVDVIFGIGGTTGNAGPEEAAAQGKYAIGVDKDQYFELVDAQPFMLTSAMKNIKLDVFTVLELNAEGNYPGGTDYFGTNGYAPYHDLENAIPAAAKAEMDVIQAGLADGTLLTNVPPVKPAEVAKPLSTTTIIIIVVVVIVLAVVVVLVTRRKKK